MLMAEKQTTTKSESENGMQNEYENEAFQTAPELAYRIISQKILDGEYHPGMKLSRRKMAEVTGMSVIPVIEALKKLEEDGLVESKPKWGSFVTIPTEEKVEESFEARQAIECQVARIMSRRMTDEQRAVLWTIAEDLDTIPYYEETVEESRERHFRFHRTLAEYTGNSFLISGLDRINLFWNLSNALIGRASKEKYPRYWHRKLMDDICSGDEDLAEKSMRIHVLDSKDAVIENVRRQQY